MADLTITPANVLAGSGASIKHGIAGAAITQGQVVCIKAATRRFHLADNNAAVAEERKPAGIALNSVAAAGQPISVLTSGQITIGPTTPAMVPNTAYYLGEAGAICTVGDLTSGAEYVALIGLAATANALNVSIQFPGGLAP